MRILAFWASALGILSGCAFSFPDYPEHWAKPVEGCYGLTGSYLNLGERGEARQDPEPELRFFLFEDAKELEKPERIDIDFSADRRLRVRAVSSSGSVAEALFSEAEATLICKKDGAEIRSYRGVTNSPGNPIVGYEHSSTVLVKAEDGSLAVKSASGGYGLVFLIVPAGGSAHYWYRFPAAR